MKALNGTLPPSIIREARDKMQTVYRIFCQTLAGTEVTICFAKTRRLAEHIIKQIPTAKLSEEILYTSDSDFKGGLN